MPKDKKAKVAVFISGGGSNLQALIDGIKAGILDAEINWVVSSTKKAFGLQRAEKERIESWIFRVDNYSSTEEAGKDLLEKLQSREIEFIALAGYLKLIPENVVRAYKNKIINIHPALLPKYGGKGMYGHFVHEAVLANKDTESGPTVHLVDEIYDNGKILEQIRVPVLPSDTPETLAARVLEQEHKLYPRVLDKLIKGKCEINDG